MKVYESPYSTIYFNEDKSLLEVVRHTPEYIPDNAYRGEMFAWLEQIKKHHPTFQLVDYTQNLYAINASMQEWVNENLIGPAYRIGCLRKVAFILSKDLFAQVSVEQTMQEPEGKQFVKQYFDTRQDALDWLFA